MQSYGLTLCLQDDPQKIETYKEYHRAVWPEVLAGLREAGIQRMQIFLLGLRMFMYVDTDDDFEAAPNEWWALMEPVFDTEWPQHKEQR
jgi:L-rhamnose mutarotase